MRVVCRSVYAACSTTPIVYIGGIIGYTGDSLRCMQGFVDRGHIFVELPVEEVIVHNVAWYIGAGGASRASDLARALSVLAGLAPEAYQVIADALGSSGFGRHRCE